MEDIIKARFENLKRSIIVSMAVILTLVEGFYFFVMKRPFFQCALEWLFGMSLSLVILHVSFRYIFRVQDQVTRHAGRLSTLNAITSAVSASLDLETMLNGALDKILEMLGTESGLIYLRDEHSDQLRVVVYRGFSPDFIAQVEKVDVDHSLSGQVVKTGQPFVGSDLATSPVIPRGLAEAQNVASFVIIPLTAKGQVLGTMNLTGATGNFSSSEDIELLSSIGRQVGIAVENAQLYVKVTDRMREARVLHKVSNTLMRTLNLEQVLDSIPEVLQRSFGYAQCAILLSDEETGELYIKATRGYLQAEGEEPRIKTGQQGIAGWVAANKVPVNVPDVTKDDRYVARVKGTRSEMAVPMLVGERIVGVLDVHSTEVNAFDESDLRTLSSVAAQAAIAIERARFFREARRRSQEQVTLFQAGATVLSSLHIDEVLYEVAKQMALAIDVTSARVCQWNEAQRNVTVIAEYIAPRASQEERVSAVGTVYPATDYETSQILRDRQPLTVSLADPEISEEVRTRLEEFGGNTVLYLPLVVREQPIGYVEVWEHRRKRHFTQEEVALCQAIGNQAAIAIENARLYAQALQDAETRALLLHELNHRVENNMAAVIGLLYAERRHAGVKEDAVYQTIMEELINRVQGLATVHSLLSASEWKPLLLSDLANQIIRAVLQAIPRHKRVSVDTSLSPVRVTPKQAHHLALVINELITNTVKHALREQDTAQITVRIALNDDTVLFEFRDDGPGYPEEVLRLERHNVGFDLIQTLVRDGLRGELALHNDHGAVTIIRFETQATF